MLRSGITTQIISKEASNLTIYDLVVKVYGKKRVDRAFTQPDKDPEVIDFMMKIDYMTNSKWKSMGITREQGPYIALT